jgi:hypothetical protein
MLKFQQEIFDVTFIKMGYFGMKLDNLFGLWQMNANKY